MIFGGKYMNFNKCCRCGCFFVSENAVCPNCEQKDLIEMGRLKNYIEENVSGSDFYNMNNVISCTGITANNLNRFLAQSQFADFASHLEKGNLD